MSVDDIVTVNNIKRAWRFLLDNIDYPVDWQYIREYNRIIGEASCATPAACVNTA